MKNKKIVIAMLLSMVSGITRSDQSGPTQSGIVISPKVLASGIALTGGALWYLKSRSDRFKAQAEKERAEVVKVITDQQSAEIKGIVDSSLDAVSVWYHGASLFSVVGWACKTGLRFFFSRYASQQRDQVVNGLTQKTAALKGAVDRVNFTDFSAQVTSGWLEEAVCSPNASIEGTPLLHYICNELSFNKPVRNKWIMCLAQNKELDLNAKDTDGSTLLHYAIKKSDFSILELLEQNKSKVNWNAEDKNGYTPLHYAVEQKDIKLVRFLKKHGAKPDLGVSRGSIAGATALHLASEVDDQPKREQIARELLQSQKVEIEACLVESKRTALAQAALVGSNDLIRLYLDNGASIEVLDKNGDTPLFIAVRNGNRSSVVELLKHDNGRTINTKNQRGDTPLCWAIRNKEYWMVRALKTVGTIDMQLSGTGGKTPVECLLDNGDAESIDILSGLRKNFASNAKVLFDKAVKDKKHLSAQFLFDVFLTDGQRRKAVRANIDSCNVELIRHLVASEHINLSYADTDGDTLLHLAAMTGCQELYSVLHQAMENKGIDCNVEGSTGETAEQVLDSMKRWKDKPIAEKNKSWWKKLF